LHTLPGINAMGRDKSTGESELKAWGAEGRESDLCRLPYRSCWWWRRRWGRHIRARTRGAASAGSSEPSGDYRPAPPESCTSSRPPRRSRESALRHTHTHTLIVISPIVAETRLLAPTSKYRQTDRQRDRQTPVERGLFPGQPLTFFLIFRTLFKIKTFKICLLCKLTVKFLCYI